MKNALPSLLLVSLTLWSTHAWAANAPVKVSDLDDKAVLLSTKGKGANIDHIPRSKETKVGIHVVYAPAQNPILKKVHERYKNARVWEKMFEPVNDALKFRNPTTFLMAECGAPGAFWNPSTWRMVICYEMVMNAKFAFEANGVSKQDIDAKVHGAIVGIAWHEFGHFIASEFDLPVVGNTEDAADLISTLVLLARNDESVRMVKAHAEMQAYVRGDAYTKGVEALLGPAPKRMQTLKAHMILHSDGRKRRHNALCLIYGSNPAGYADLVGGNGLHPTRAARCENEFQSISRAWTKLIMPHSYPPSEIAKKRCTLATHVILALMRSSGAPAKILQDAQKGKDNDIAKCTAAYLKDPETTQKAVLCMRYAKTFAEARACKK